MYIVVHNEKKIENMTNLFIFSCFKYSAQKLLREVAQKCNNKSRGYPVQGESELCHFLLHKFP